MSPELCNVSMLAVTAIFYTYRNYRDSLFGKERKLRERVTYLLWVAANGAT